jgi:hypothetical protein
MAYQFWLLKIDRQLVNNREAHYAIKGSKSRIMAHNRLVLEYTQVRTVGLPCHVVEAQVNIGEILLALIVSLR